MPLEVAIDSQTLMSCISSSDQAVGVIRPCLQELEAAEKVGSKLSEGKHKIGSYLPLEAFKRSPQYEASKTRVRL